MCSFHNKRLFAICRKTKWFIYGVDMKMKSNWPTEQILDAEGFYFYANMNKDSFLLYLRINTFLYFILFLSFLLSNESRIDQMLANWFYDRNRWKNGEHWSISLFYGHLKRVTRSVSPKGYKLWLTLMRDGISLF